MANNKTGLNYYGVDTDRYMDLRVRRLVKDHGCRGLAVYDYLLCEIYRVQGCFAVWDESTAFNVAEYFGLKESNVLEIVKYCGVVGLFDKELLSRGIITSASIQRRYLEMCSRAKRRIIKIPEICRIIPEQSAIIPEQSAIIPKVCGKRKKNISSPNVEDIPPYNPPKGEGDTESSPESDKPSSSKKKEKVAAKRKKAIDISAVEPTFQPIVADWLEYKSERGQTYRQKGFDAFYSRLRTLSDGDPHRAREIIEQSKANNWAGIFALGNVLHGNGTRTSGNQPPSDDDLARAVAEGWARAHTRQEWEQ